MISRGRPTPLGEFGITLTAITTKITSGRPASVHSHNRLNPAAHHAVHQKLNETPVVMENADRRAGPEMSVPTPPSHTSRGVS